MLSPRRSQAAVAALQQMAESMFPEGKGSPSAAAKAAAAAELTNELIVHAKEAVDDSGRLEDTSR